MECRFCKTQLTQENVFIDLINAPASNSFLTADKLNEPETFYPLKVYTCPECFLVQIDEYKKSNEIFDSEYAYFSSYSQSWLKHAKEYTEMIVNRLNLTEKSFVIELASNDGYLLQYFQQKKIPVVGVEPSKNTAKEAMEKGIVTIVNFFGVALAKDILENKMLPKPDLIIGNNVLAHVPDIVDFVAGMQILLGIDGVITMEFPHLLQLVQNTQFDTIYHEHFSYLSLHTVRRIFESVGLEIFDVEEIKTHGGSLRIYARHIRLSSKKEFTDRLLKVMEDEATAGIMQQSFYKDFAKEALRKKINFTDFLLNEKSEFKKIAAYGAAAKGNTFLNYCGIKSDIIDFVVDASRHKQGKFLPGSHIPVVDEDYLKENKPHYVIILPWNIQEEIMENLSYIKQWGGKFVVAIPELKII